MLCEIIYSGKDKYSFQKLPENLLFWIYLPHLKVLLLNPWFMEPEGSMPRSQGLSNNPYSKPNETNSRIDTHFFKIHSNIDLSFMLRPSNRPIS